MRWNENQFDTVPSPEPPYVPFRSLLASVAGVRFKANMQQYVLSTAEAAKLAEKLMKNINATMPPVTINFDPKVPTRQPHWQAPAPGSFQYDHRGRKRY